MKAVAKALKTPGAGKGKLASKPAIVRPRRDVCSSSSLQAYWSVPIKPLAVLRRIAAS